MISAARPVQRIVLYEGRDSRPLETETRLALLQTLLERGYVVSSARPGQKLAENGRHPLIVLGQFNDDSPNLVVDESGQIPVRVHDISRLDTAAVLELVGKLCEELGTGTANGWKPWFPVIDFGRCTNCMQCLSFCLFDVYGVTQDGKIQVRNESNCKTDCPACSRVCPEVAIMFPKYKAGPINGDEVNSEDVRREAMKVDVSALLGGDIYSMLRDRSAKAKSRFSKERDDDRALRERMRCLEKLQRDMGDLEVPPELLASLPSADEIQAKAAEAKRRAQEALERAQATTAR